MRNLQNQLLNVYKWQRLLQVYGVSDTIEEHLHRDLSKWYYIFGEVDSIQKHNSRECECLLVMLCLSEWFPMSVLLFECMFSMQGQLFIGLPGH